MRTQARFIPAWTLLPIAVFAMLSTFSEGADAQRKEREGKEVVDAVCGACHTPGKDNAPRIGDVNAWASRASQGLTALTAHALNGIRKMPAHGGNPGVSDIEIERAIVYMVNQSGGTWVEPVGGATPAIVRTAGTVVQTQCAKCHQAGRDGAPKMGDRPAWTARLAKGLDGLVASAVHGHGPMPSRGGMPDLSREEIRGAILYMFNYGLPAVPPAPLIAATDPHHKLVSGLDIYFGTMRAEAVRAAQAQAEKCGPAKVEKCGTTKADAPFGKVDVPSGKGYYHLNISVSDNKSQTLVTDAQVTMRVSDGVTTETKALGLVAANNAVSYGNYFRLSRGSAYNITTEIRRPGVPGAVVATFGYREP